MGFFKKGLNQKSSKYFFYPALLLFFFIFIYSSYINRIPLFYNDEYYWISNSYFFELFIKGDFKNQLWKSQWAFDQPRLAEYYYGLTLYPLYIKEKTITNESNYTYRRFLISHYFYEIPDKEHSDYKNKVSNFINWGPDKSGSADFLSKIYGINFVKISELILYARRFNVLLLSINIIIVYFIALIAFDKFIATITIIIYGFNKLNVMSSILVHSEVLFSLLFNLGLLLLILIFKKNKENKIQIKGDVYINEKLVLLFALIASLCAQTKLNGIILLFIFVFLILLRSFYLLINKQIYKIYKAFLSVFFCFIVFSIFFVIINPSLYKNPLSSSVLLFKNRFAVARTQTKEYPSSYLPTINSRIKIIYKRFFSFNNENNLSKFIIYSNNNFPYGIFFYFSSSWGLHK